MKMDICMYLISKDAESVFQMNEIKIKVVVNHVVVV